MSWRLVGVGVFSAVTAACSTPLKNADRQAVKLGPTHSAVNTCATLVPIAAQTTAGGIAEEQAWLARRYPGAIKLREQVTDCDGRPVDRVTIRHEGKDMTILFDISSYFGKVGEDDLDDLLDG
ncbi:hypothetical protein [Parvularcula sp. LCG005]|uniref:hypothetical protein n=1 Tax=Parvularcula sp. LCG005 TaxID=3078805 RepID=UPI00294208C2|nr:hypothetical protein [Parvularcula sp. LCG005]WOI53846.1 hypothetical protein RUI03_02320 [Parvularcula sp. LCG005]